MVRFSFDTLSLLLASGVLQLPCLAFKRTSPDVSPFAYPYTELAGSLNLTESQFTPNQRLNSWYFVYYVSATNGHDYFVFGQAGEGIQSNVAGRHYRTALLDLTEKTYSGSTIIDSESTISNKTFLFQSKSFKTYATTPDLFSTMVAVSTEENSTYILVAQPKGPNLYHGGSGSWIWGDGRTYQRGAPELWVTGNLTYKGEVVDVIPEKSSGWFDRQFGLGYDAAGWYLFMFMLENGVKASIWYTNPRFRGDTVVRMATIMYPDGHHELYTVAEDINRAIPFTSSVTNLTYYGHFEIEVVGLDTTLCFDLPVLVGEMVSADSTSTEFTLLETYMDVSGTFKGQPIKGYGVSEQRDG